MRELGLDAVVDIECESWDRFVRGVILDACGRARVYSDAGRFARAVLELGERTVWAHAGGRYDFLFLLERFLRLGAECLLRVSGSSVHAIEVRGGPVLRDSFRLAPMSLRKFSQWGGVEKGEVGLRCTCGRACGGYCAIRRDLPRAAMRRLEEYLVRDGEALLAALRALFAEAEAREITLRPTIGGTAWATARVWLDLPDAEWDRGHYGYARSGYFGGRCEVARVFAPRGARYDIHSSYPAALSRTALPIGTSRLVVGRAAARAWRAGRPGIYTASVYVPEHYAPPLPVRGRDRLYFPSGRIRGTWTALELAAAESYGAKVEEVVSALIWRSERPILAPFARRVWDLRAAAANSAAALWYKLLGNSLTGKLAQRPEYEEWGIGDPPKGSFYIHDQWPIWRRTVAVMPRCGHVQWAAYLTAAARVELLAEIRHAGESWVYSDTDSVYATRRLTRRVGDHLGEWGFEGEFRNFEAIAPKVYRYRAGENDVVRGKGMSGLDSAGYDVLRCGGTWTADQGVSTFRAAVRAGGPLFVRRHLSRQLRPRAGWVGGRILEADEIRTRPPRAEEIF